MIIFIVTGIALIIPNFDDFLNIAGSLTAGIIAFILPPLLYNIEFKAEISRFHYWFNFSILIFGIFGSTLSILTSIQSINAAT